MKQTYDTPVMCSTPGLLRRHVAALFDDRDSAERVRRALVLSGFDGTEIHVLGPQDLRCDAGREGRGLLTRIRSIVLWDERAAMATYPRALENQHVLMIVPAYGVPQISRVRGIAAQFGAQSMRYFGNWTVRELGHGAGSGPVQVPEARSLGAGAMYHTPRVPTAA